MIRFVSRIPVLAAEPDFQHTTRINLAADLHRYNPLFVPLISLSAGMGLGLLRSFDPRWWWLTVALTALLTWTSTFVPYLVPGIVLAIGGNRQGSRAVWLFAGIGFAFTAAAIWVGTPGGPLIGTVLFVIGALLADRIWRVVAVPTRGGVVGLATLAGIVMPALTGIIDLSLRARIP